MNFTRKKIIIAIFGIILLAGIGYGAFFSGSIGFRASKTYNSVENKNSEIKLVSFKKDFKSAEDPELKFQYQYQKPDKGIISAVGEALGISGKDKIKVTAKVTDPKGKTRDVLPEEIIENNGEISVKLKKESGFKPGLYQVTIEVEDKGVKKEITQDFTWGVLAINTNKSIYVDSKLQNTNNKSQTNSNDQNTNIENGELAYIQMAALTDTGHTVCDASLKLEIRNPKSETAIFSTSESEVRSPNAAPSAENGVIERSGKCSGDNVTDVPDYFAHYTVGEAGTYEMKLTNLDNGYEIADSFEVRESVPFDVERIGPTRIYPPAGYEMVLKIKANQDFSGEIRESVPEGFEIVEAEMTRINTRNDAENSETDISVNPLLDQRKSASITMENGVKKIIWDASWQSGENHELRYQFNAPDISPYIYLLGPLRFYE